jgi:hypothetical protein
LALAKDQKDQMSSGACDQNGQEAMDFAKDQRPTTKENREDVACA